MISRTLTSLYVAMGSSGAWVVRGDKLCGYIVAIRQDIPWAYMVAIQSVFKDIGRKFNTDDVRLPTAAELKSFAKVSEPELALSNVQEWTQALSSGDTRNETPANDSIEIGKARRKLNMGDKSIKPSFGTDINSSPTSPAVVFSEDISENINQNEVLLMNASDVARNQSVNITSQVSNARDEQLNEKSSVAAHPFRPELLPCAEPPLRAEVEISHSLWRTEFELAGPLPVDLPGNLDEPRQYPTSQRVSNHSSSTRNDELTGHGMLMSSQMDLEAATHKPPRKADLSTSKFAVFRPFSRQFVNRSGQIWHAFEALILRIEYRRRRERCRSSVFLVRMMWKPITVSDLPWTSHKTQRWIDRWLYYWYYYTIFMFGNILLNLLYCIFLFPFILWVLYRHHDVLEGPRAQEQFQASIEMLGRLPDRYNDYQLLEQRALRNSESGSVHF